MPTMCCMLKSQPILRLLALHTSFAGISQLLDFLQPDSRPKRAPTRSKSKPKAQLAPPSKAAAARQAAGRKAAGPPRSGSSGGSTAAAAAGAAALQRASGGGGSSGAAGSSNAAEQVGHVVFNRKPLMGHRGVQQSTFGL
jgi:hypothetical protein